MIILLMPFAATAVGQQVVSYETADGFEIVAHYHEPDSSSSRGILILPDPGEGKDAWIGFAEQLRAAGYHLLVADPRGTGESRTQRNQRRERLSFTSRELAAADLDGLAGLRYLFDLPSDEIDRVVLIGSKAGASAAMRAVTEPGVLGALLVSPQEGPTGWPETIARPVRILVGRDDLLGIEATGDLLEIDGTIECWIVDGLGLGVEFLESRRDLISRWTEWIDRLEREASGGR